MAWDNTTLEISAVDGKIIINQIRSGMFRESFCCLDQTIGSFIRACSSGVVNFGNRNFKIKFTDEEIQNIYGGFSIEKIVKVERENDFL